MITRRDLIRLLLASPIAATVDVEQLLWVPKPIIVVPAMPEPSALRKMFMYGTIGWVRWDELNPDKIDWATFTTRMPMDRWGKLVIKL